MDTYADDLTELMDALDLKGATLQGGLRNEHECIMAFSETDFTEDLKKFNVPTLIIHGNDDQIVTISYYIKGTLLNSSGMRH